MSSIHAANTPQDSKSGLPQARSAQRFVFKRLRNTHRNSYLRHLRRLPSPGSVQIIRSWGYLRRFGGIAKDMPELVQNTERAQIGKWVLGRMRQEKVDSLGKPELDAGEGSVPPRRGS